MGQGDEDIFIQFMHPIIPKIIVALLSSLGTGMLELVYNGASRVEFHVVFKCVTSIESFGTQMTGKWHLPTVYKHVLLQMMFHAKSFRALAASKWS